MAKKGLITTSDLERMRVRGGKSGRKNIGRVKMCVFHPKEKRCIGFIVKRPDLLWMFHRKDVFVALDEFEFVDGRIVVAPESKMSGPAACKRMGLNWDSCILWSGLPLMVDEETAIGTVGTVTFSRITGDIESVVASNGVTSRYLLGTLEVPADCILGFRRGMGVDLSAGDAAAGSESGQTFKGAILVSDDVWELQPEGGWAEAAGEFTAKAQAKIQEATDAVTPKAQAAAAAAGDAINKGAYATGKQIAASKGMFSSFKEEYRRARTGDDEALAVSSDGDADGAPDVDESRPKASSKPEGASGSGSTSSIGGMFAAFKEEYDKASK